MIFALNSGRTTGNPEAIPGRKSASGKLGFSGQQNFEPIQRRGPSRENSLHSYRHDCKRSRSQGSVDGIACILPGDAILALQNTEALSFTSNAVERPKPRLPNVIGHIFPVGFRGRKNETHKLAVAGVFSIRPKIIGKRKKGCAPPSSP